MYLKNSLKHGEKLQMWLSKLKIAIVQKDTASMQKLLDTTPNFSSEKESTEALYLMANAIELVTNLKDKTQISMQQMKKNIEFLETTQSEITSKLDLKS